MATVPRPPDASRGGPLAGRRIVLTRPLEQAGDFVERIAALGGVGEVAPAIAIAPPHDAEPLDAALADLASFHWIAFTSANAVRALAARARTQGMGCDRFATLRLAAVGAATAAALERELRRPDAVARTATARSLGAELPVRRGERVLVPRADLAEDALAAELRARGAKPHDVVSYRTVPGDGIPRIVAGLVASEIDALLFASGSAARFTAEALSAAGGAPRRSGPAGRPAIFCIGPSTARAAEAAGFSASAVAPVATQRALIDAVAGWFARDSGVA